MTQPSQWRDAATGFGADSRPRLRGGIVMTFFTLCAPGPTVAWQARTLDFVAAARE